MYAFEGHFGNKKCSTEHVQADGAALTAMELL